MGGSSTRLEDGEKTDQQKYISSDAATKRRDRKLARSETSLPLDPMIGSGPTPIGKRTPSPHPPTIRPQHMEMAEIHRQDSFVERSKESSLQYHSSPKRPYRPDALEELGEFVLTPPPLSDTSSHSEKSRSRYAQQFPHSSSSYMNSSPTPSYVRSFYSPVQSPLQSPSPARKGNSSSPRSLTRENSMTSFATAVSEPYRDDDHYTAGYAR